MQHKGTQTLYTGRLILRQFLLGDAQDMFESWAGDPEVTKYLTWPAHSDVGVTKAVISSWVNSYGNERSYQWAILSKETGKAIGGISVVKIDDRLASCEVGYCLGRAQWGKGIMTEALERIIGYLINDIGFIRVMALHDTENPASGRVMEKCGMGYEGVVKGYEKRKDGTSCDLAVYSILKKDLRYKDT